MVTDTNGNLDTTSVYPLSFSANKPVVTDVAGNLTDITLTTYLLLRDHKDTPQVLSVSHSEKHPQIPPSTLFL